MHEACMHVYVWIVSHMCNECWYVYLSVTAEFAGPRAGTKKLPPARPFNNSLQDVGSGNKTRYLCAFINAN